MTTDPKTEIANELYDNIFEFLDGLAKRDTSLRFTVRKSNLGSKLDRKFWFYGNNHYIALSFNYGFDYVNNTPNLALIIDLSNSNHYLLITNRDDDRKRVPIEKYILPLIGKENLTINNKGQYEFYFQEKNPIKVISDYVDGLRIAIQEKIRMHEEEFKKASDSDINSIRLIGPGDFSNGLQKIYSYRQRLSPEKLKSKLAQFIVQNYGPIASVRSGRIPSDCNFIFITGKNGTGKSSLLRAITTGICLNWDGDTELSQDQGLYHIILSVDNNGYTTNHDITPGNQRSPGNEIVTKGFAAYGASRLIINNRDRRPTTNALGSDITKLTHSIFYPDGILKDIGKSIVLWHKNLNDDELSRRVDNIIKALTRICQPALKNIFIRNDETFYVELDENEQAFPAVTFERLASGVKSIIAMFGDMMVRLFEQQPQIDDPSDLMGVVLIDEIDIHLHPILQKEIVQKLAVVFPRIQFIITTHSPIPLLGAPKNSLFYRISRNVKDSVILERFDDLHISQLMPNAIISSPLFGLKDLTSSEEKDHKMIRTEDSWDDIKLNEKRKSDIKRILDELK